MHVYARRGRCTWINPVLPLAWQELAICLARPCHLLGKTLPLTWQNFAKRLARPGKMRLVDNSAYNRAVRKLFVMVGAAIQYCHGPVYLLYENKAYHLMRECHFRH